MVGQSEPSGTISAADESSRTPLLIAARELATILSVSTRTVWRLLSAGKLIPPVRIGSTVRWRYDEVRDWVRAGCPVPLHSSSVRK